MPVADIAIVQEIPKQQLSKDLILSSSLNEDTMDYCVQAFVDVAFTVQELKSNKPEISQERVIELVKERLLSDAFIYPMQLKIEEDFTQDELEILIAYFQTDLMKRYNRTQIDLSDVLGDAINRAIEEVISELSS